MAWGTALGSGGARPLAHKATVGCDSTNDRAERAIGYFSHVYNTYGTISSRAPPASPPPASTTSSASARTTREPRPLPRAAARDEVSFKVNTRSVLRHSRGAPPGRKYDSIYIAYIPTVNPRKYYTHTESTETCSTPPWPHTSCSLVVVLSWCLIRTSPSPQPAYESCSPCATHCPTAQPRHTITFHCPLPPKNFHEDNELAAVKRSLFSRSSRFVERCELTEFCLR